MTKEEFAAALNGRTIGNEMTKSEERLAKAAGLVVVYGASDDLMEFRGCIEDEAGCYDGGLVLFTAKGLLTDHCGFKEIKKTAFGIDADWCADDAIATWTYKTKIPHAKFLIVEDGENFCEGIVFDFKDIQK